MIVAVSLVMQKDGVAQYAVHARLAIIKECASVDEAIDIAMVRAQIDEVDYRIVSVCAAEVTMSPVRCHQCNKILVQEDDPVCIDCFVGMQ
jgi:hypothetical protein